MFAWTREGRIDTVRTSSERWTINVRPNKGKGEGLTQCELFPKGGPLMFARMSGATSLLSDSRSVLSSIFPFTSISLAGTVFSLLVLSGCNGSAKTRAPCNLSPLISRIHPSLFSDWRRTVSSKFFDTQVPSISTEELVLPRHAHCVLSRLRCNGHSLSVSFYHSKIGRVENPSRSAREHSSQDISHLILHCPATNSAPLTLSLYYLWSRPWGVNQLLGLHGLPPCPYPSEGVA